MSLFVFQARDTTLHFFWVKMSIEEVILHYYGLNSKLISSNRNVHSGGDSPFNTGLFRSSSAATGTASAVVIPI